MELQLKLERLMIPNFYHHSRVRTANFLHARSTLLLWRSTEAYSEPSKTSKMELFAKTVTGFQPWTIFEQNSIFDIWQDSEYASSAEGYMTTLAWKRLEIYHHQNIRFVSKVVVFILNQVKFNWSEISSFISGFKPKPTI